MNEHREGHLDLCAAYALGNLEPAERRALEEHLDRGCPTCEEALAQFSDATVLLAASAPAAMPGPALKGRVLELVAAEAKAGPSQKADQRGQVVEFKRRSGFAWGTSLLAAAAAGLAITSIMFFREAGRLSSELEATRHDLGMVARQLAEEQRLNEVLSAPGARVAVLELTPAGEQALRARATYDPATRSAVLVFENFRPPAGQDYELWAIRGAVPASLGLIRADERGNAVMRITDAGDPAILNAFAVSLEPAGGSPNPAAPSGPVVMLGKLGG